MENDFIIFYDVEVENDSKTMNTVLTNLNFSVSRIKFANLNQFDIYSGNNRKKIPILIILSKFGNGNNQALKLISKLQFPFFLHLIKIQDDSTFDSKQNHSENTLFYNEIEGNNLLARKILSLISDSDLLVYSDTNNERINDYHNTIKVYSNSNFSNSYFDKWRDKMPSDKLDYFSTLLPKGALILDAGCGPGHHSNYLSSKGFNIIGIDLSPISIEIAKRHAIPNTEFFVRDALNSGMESNSLHGIWSCAAMIHFPQSLLKLQLIEFNRILSFRGIIAITMAIGQKQHSDGFGRFFESYRNSQVIRELLKKMGFKVIKIDDEITWSSTQGDLRMINWVTFYSEKIT